MRILMVMAHPDDEVIFGWPVLQNVKASDNTVALLLLSNNGKKLGAGPVKAAMDVCAANDVGVYGIEGFDNNFYRLPPRYEPGLLLKDIIRIFRERIGEAIQIWKPDYIFTHNPWGEYGHGDHRFVSALVTGFDVCVLMTDICFANGCHLSYTKLPLFWQRLYYLAGQTVSKDIDKNRIFQTTHILDLQWYNRMKEIYDMHKAWTWGGHRAVMTCKLLRFG